MERNGQVSPPALKPSEQCKFKLAYLASVAIEAGIESGCVHYRNRAGVLLGTWQEVIDAVLAGELAEVGA